MKKRYILLLILLLTFLSCIQSKTVTIRAIVENRMKDNVEHYYEIELLRNRTELVLMASVFDNVKMIEGLDKLKDLTKLDIRLGHNQSDYSFIKNMKKLKILIMLACEIADLAFLKDLKDLEVLILESQIYKNEIDLINNKKLKYISILNLIYSEKSIPANDFVPNIKNIPDSLTYIVINQSPYIILSKDFLIKLINIPYVILGPVDFNRLEKDMVKDRNFDESDKSYITNRDFIIEHKNFILKEPDEVLPIVYRDEVLYNKWLEEDIWDKMEEVPPFKD